MLGSTGRFAGQALKSLFKVPGTDRMLSKGDIAFRLFPDLMFGGVEAALTPGDMADKLIAGGSTALGSSLGGLALGRLGGKNQLLGQALDIAGSLGGDFGGRAIGEQVQRGKDKIAGGKGQTPYERLGEEDQQRLEKLIRDDQTARVLAELGLLPASTQSALIS